MLAVALTVPCISCINYDRVVSIIMPINVLACVDTDLPINLSQFVVYGRSLVLLTRVAIFITYLEFQCSN